MNISEKLFDYLKIKLPDFKKESKNGAYLFTCPNIIKHRAKNLSPTTTVIAGTEKINCFQCSWKGTFYDVVRLLEEDKIQWADEKISEYLINSLQINIYKELEVYKQYGWSLLPITKNSKIPAEKGWTEKTHYEKVEWLKWLNGGYNIGVRTGEVSNITVVDIDCKNGEIEARKEILDLLKASNTVVQNTPSGGKHYLFKYDKEIQTGVNLGGYSIDIRNDGAEIVIQPSKVQNQYVFVNLGEEIKEMSIELKQKLIEISKSGNKIEVLEKIKESDLKVGSGDDVTKVKEGEGRNNLLVKLGGILTYKMDTQSLYDTLSLINQTFCNPPLPSFEIKAMLESLTKYRQDAETTVENQIYEYLKLIQTNVRAEDVVKSLKLERGVVDKYLSQFVKEGKAVRLARGTYKYKEKLEWSDKMMKQFDICKYSVPYFEEVAIFESGDVILLGGKTSAGKTTIALNVLKQLIEQGIKPFYIYSESGSRHQKIAQALKLPEGSFYHSFHSNPLSIEIEPNSFTVLDWLCIQDKENTDTIFKFFAEEMQRKGGLLVIMMQLKEGRDTDYEWFAPNLVKQYPAVAARYIFDDENGKFTHWQVDKIREPKGNFRNYCIPCEYDFETKILRKKVELQ